MPGASPVLVNARMRTLAPLVLSMMVTTARITAPACSSRQA
jgi:hypothetical protein